jgi:hypothetical protein
MGSAPSDHPGVLPQLQLDDLLAELQSRLQVVRGTRDRMRSLLQAFVAVGAGLDLESAQADCRNRRRAGRRPVRCARRDRRR